MNSAISYFFEVNFNITLPSTPRPTKWCLSFTLPYQAYAFLLCPIRVKYPACHPRLDLIISEVQVQVQVLYRLDVTPRKSKGAYHEKIAVMWQGAFSQPFRLPTESRLMSEINGRASHKRMIQRRVKYCTDIRTRADRHKKQMRYK